MRKAILLTVSLWVEGEDEPIHDWSVTAVRAVREIIAAGKRTHPELEVNIAAIEGAEGRTTEDGSLTR